MGVGIFYFGLGLWFFWIYCLLSFGLCTCIFYRDVVGRLGWLGF